MLAAKEPPAYRVKVEHELTTPDDPVAAVVSRALELHLEGGPRARRTMLCFLPCPRDAELAAMKLQHELWHAFKAAAVGRGRARAAGVAPCNVMVCHEEMSGAELSQCCTPEQEGRLIIMATQIAESAWPIPDVAIVIDSGVVTRPRYRPAWVVDTVVDDQISAAAHERRQACAAASASGVHYCMYTKQVCAAVMLVWVAVVSRWVCRQALAHDSGRCWVRGVCCAKDLDGFPLEDESATERVTIPWLLLQVKAVSSNYSRLFLTYNEPNGAQVSRGMQLLQQLGAVDDAGDVTHRGAKLAALNLPPLAAAAVLEVSRRRQGTQLRQCLTCWAAALAAVCRRPLVVWTTRVRRCSAPWPGTGCPSCLRRLCPTRSRWLWRRAR